jgi:hypothetical protein
MVASNTGAASEHRFFQGRSTGLFTELEDSPTQFADLQLHRPTAGWIMRKRGLIIATALWGGIALIAGGIAMGHSLWVIAGLGVLAIAALQRPTQPELDERGPPL